MDTHSTTMPIDWDRIGPTWRAILVAVFDAGHTCGGGEAVELAAHEPTRELLLKIMEHYDAECSAVGPWIPLRYEPALRSDEVPGWLREQQRQKETAS